jgi:hypothetical protein
MLANFFGRRTWREPDDQGAAFDVAGPTGFLTQPSRSTVRQTRLRDQAVDRLMISEKARQLMGGSSDEKIMRLKSIARRIRFDTISRGFRRLLPNDKRIVE